MAYCRWSSDNFQCDLYCYEDVHGGYTTHVAGGRRKWAPWLNPYSGAALGRLSSSKDAAINKRWQLLYRAYHDALKQIDIEDIELPHAGESFNDPTLEEFLLRVHELAALGYNVPPHVFTAIEDEIREDGEAENYAAP